MPWTKCVQFGCSRVKTLYYKLIVRQRHHTRWYFMPGTIHPVVDTHRIVPFFAATLIFNNHFDWQHKNDVRPSVRTARATNKNGDIDDKNIGTIATSRTKRENGSRAKGRIAMKNCIVNAYEKIFYWQTCRRRTLLLSGYRTAALHTIMCEYATVRDNQILAAAAAGAASGWQWHGFMVALINDTAILKLNLGVATVSQWAPMNMSSNRSTIAAGAWITKESPCSSLWDADECIRRTLTLG